MSFKLLSTAFIIHEFDSRIFVDHPNVVSFNLAASYAKRFPSIFNQLPFEKFSNIRKSAFSLPFLYDLASNSPSLFSLFVKSNPKHFNDILDFSSSLFFSPFETLSFEHESEFSDLLIFILNDPVFFEISSFQHHRVLTMCLSKLDPSSISYIFDSSPLVCNLLLEPISGCSGNTSFHFFARNNPALFLTFLSKESQYLDQLIFSRNDLSETPLHLLASDAPSYFYSLISSYPNLIQSLQSNLHLYSESPFTVLWKNKPSLFLNILCEQSDSIGFLCKSKCMGEDSTFLMFLKQNLDLSLSDFFSKPSFQSVLSGADFGNYPSFLFFLADQSPIYFESVVLNNPKLIDDHLFSASYTSVFHVLAENSPDTFCDFYLNSPSLLRDKILASSTFENRSPFHFIARYQPSIFLDLIKRSPDLVESIFNRVDISHHSPFHYLAEFQPDVFCSLFLSFSEFQSFLSKGENSPLYLLSRYNPKKFVYLIENHSDLLSFSNSSQIYYSLSSLASSHPDFFVELFSLVDSVKHSIFNLRFNNNESPMEIFAMSHPVCFYEFLISQQDSILEIINTYENASSSPFHFSVYSDPESILFFIDQCPSHFESLCSLKNDLGFSPIHLLASLEPDLLSDFLDSHPILRDVCSLHKNNQNLTAIDLIS